jgi:hypothetical protein
VSDYLDAVERQLAELTERGAHRRLRARTKVVVAARHAGARGTDPTGGGANGGPGGRDRRRRDALLAAPALLIVVVVAAVMLSIGLGSHRASVGARGAHSTTTARPATTHRPSRRPGASRSSPPASTSPAPVTSPATAPAGPVPPGFAPQSFTAVSAETWWLLGTAPCSSPPCTSIVRTDNGGRSFVGIPAPRTSSVSQLRFADGENGFAYGSQLWVTHNAGAAWHPVSLGGSVADLALADGYAYAIVRSRSGAGRLARAAVGADAWTTLAAAGDAFAGLWAHGSDVMLESAGRSSSGDEFRISHDHGTSFARHAVPPSLVCDFQEPVAPVVWAHCATGMLSGTWRSTASGAEFIPAPGGPARPGPELPNSAAFAAASATTAIVGFRQLYRTTDSGARYAPIAGPAGITFWQYLGFTDVTHGVALGYAGAATPAHERLFYTTDGGLSYHAVAVR